MFKCLIFLISFMFSASVLADERVILNVDNTLVLDDYFYSRSTSNLAKKAKELDARLPSNQPLYLVLDSGGGSIHYGLELINVLKNMNRPVHTITLFAASMGFQTVQGLGTRYIMPFGTLMSHKARGGFYGEFPGQLDSRYDWYLRRLDMMDQTTVERTNGKLTLETYRSLVENEYWCDGPTCIDKGFADVIVDATCDESLAGSFERELFWFTYMGLLIEIIEVKANCPIITGALEIKFLVNGKPLKEFIKSEAKYNTQAWVTPKYSQEDFVAIQKKVDEYVESLPKRPEVRLEP